MAGWDGHPNKGTKMNYASTITAEAQDDVSADVAVGHDPHNASSLRRNLLIAGGLLFALLAHAQVVPELDNGYVYGEERPRDRRNRRR